MDNAVALGTAGSPRLSGHALRILKDEKLAAMVATGNDDAFAMLYQRHHQAIYRYCRALVGQEADARDALQSSMLAALSSLRASPIEGAFKPWLFRIAHNQSISIIRGRTRESPTEAPPEAASSDDAETREELRTLVSDLGELPERQRSAIVMRELNGLSYVQIAAALATSEAAGKQLVYEARTAMHELREGHEMSCDLVRERISAGDRRLLRGRKVRSHLRGCQPCQDFERGIDRRRSAFAALAPPIPALAAAAVLQDVFGAGGGGGGAVAGGSAGVAAGGAASGGASIGGAAALKVTAAALLAGAAGVGAYEAGSAIFDGSPASPSALAGVNAPAAQAGDRTAGAGDSAHAGRAAADGKGKAGDGAGAKGDATADGPKAAGVAAEDGDGSSSGASAGSDVSLGGGASGGGSGGGDPPDPPPPPPPDPPPPPPDPPPPTGAPPGTPPGHGGTPPGQGGTPPGQIGGGTPPGHLGNPNHP